MMAVALALLVASLVVRIEREQPRVALDTKAGFEASEDAAGGVGRARCRQTRVERHVLAGATQLTVKEPVRRRRRTLLRGARPSTRCHRRAPTTRAASRQHRCLQAFEQVFSRQVSVEPDQLGCRNGGGFDEVRERHTEERAHRDFECVEAESVPEIHLRKHFSSRGPGEELSLELLVHVCSCHPGCEHRGSLNAGLQVVEDLALIDGRTRALPDVRKCHGQRLVGTNDREARNDARELAAGPIEAELIHPELLEEACRRLPLERELRLFEPIRVTV
mmetsp:Transcript_47677/g.112508  ORF Transcript_47677/g.112508 Transcript_47677/m.112508 type:complete len:277 (+) Transcript_47677:692-1522(+)